MTITAQNAPTLSIATRDLTGVILAAVSHDLRSPVASIKAAGTSLLSAEVDWEADTVREFATMVNEQADRLSLIISSRACSTSVESRGVLKAVAKPVYIDDVVETAIDTLGLERSRVVVDIPVQMDAITTDEGLLERAMATPAHRAIDIRVIDRGPGIPPHRRGSVFLPFCRLARAKGSAQGLGLGLAVARAFVRANGGNLTVEDTPGGGATFVFRLSRC
jgi:two-component system sensor histidine kinase KdpD